MYPDWQIVAKRRVGYLSKNPAVLYSMVCYKESTEQQLVTISGVVTHQVQAWSFEMKVDEPAFTDTLMLVFETLSDLPFNKSLQPGTESGG